VARAGRVLRVLLSFEVVFTLFLFAGRFKADPAFAWVPVDLTALLFALSVAMGGVILLRRRFAVPRYGLAATATLVAFVTWGAVSLAWSPSGEYGPYKALLLVSVVPWAFGAAALIIAPDIRRLRRFYGALVGFGLWMALESLLVLVQSPDGGFVRAFGGHYLGVGRTLGLACAVLLVAILFARKRPLARLASLALLAGFQFLMLEAGGRGPLLATLASFAVPGVVGWRVARGSDVRFAARHHLRWLVPLAVAAALALTALVGTGYDSTTLARIETLVTEERGGTSAAGRLSFFGTAWSAWLDAPLVGKGLGAFPLLHGLADVRAYPHNLVLETLAETGLIGLALLAATLIVPLRVHSLRSLHDDPLALIATMLLANTLLNAMVSGDVTDNRLVFLALGLLAGSAPSRAYGRVEPGGRRGYALRHG
jgi:O-antigen ligase